MTTRPSVLKETYVQVAPNSTGSKIRNVEILTQQSDGTTALVEMQVVGMAGRDGYLLDLDIRETIQDLVEVQKGVRALLLLLVNEMTDNALTIGDLELNE